MASKIKYIANQSIGLYISKGSEFELMGRDYVVHLVGTSLKLYLNKHYIEVFKDMKMLDKYAPTKSGGQNK